MNESPSTAVNDLAKDVKKAMASCGSANTGVQSATNGGMHTTKETAIDPCSSIGAKCAPKGS